MIVLFLLDQYNLHKKAISEVYIFFFFRHITAKISKIKNVHKDSEDILIGSDKKNKKQTIIKAQDPVFIYSTKYLCIRHLKRNLIENSNDGGLTKIE